MPPLFETAKQFLGFAKAAKAAEPAVSFVHETMAGMSQISMKIAGETHGYVAWETKGRRATIYSSLLAEGHEGKGFGRMMYEKAAEAARLEGATEFTSDVSHTEEAAARVWKSLARRGFKITEQAEGPKFIMDLSYNNLMTREMMRTGQGSSTVSELSRSISNPVLGSRKTSRAL